MGNLFKDYFKHHARCPKCRSDDIDITNDPEYEEDTLLSPVKCNACEFAWMDVYKLQRITDRNGEILADRDIPSSDLVIIFEFAKGALYDDSTRRNLLNTLDLPDEEAARIGKIIDDYLDPPEPRTCAVCGKKAIVDEFCDVCARSITNVVGSALQEFNKALNAGPHDHTEERLILESFALKVARELKARIQK